MTKIHTSLILDTAVEIFARGGLGEFSIRRLAGQIGIAPSVIYHYFPDEDTLLRSMFDYANHELGLRRSLLKYPKTTSALLRQRIAFQLDNAELIVAVLKYYFAYRSTFPKNKHGYVPDKSALHMEEVLQFARERGEYTRKTLEDDAKVMTHAVNGFLLEYYPHKVEGTEKKQLVQRIHRFLMYAVKGGESL